MKLQRGWAGVLMLLLVVSPPIAYAEMIQGNVLFVNLEANLFKMEGKDPLSGKEKSFDIVVTSDTVLDGIASILELKIGDEIAVEAKPTQDERTWNATSVDVPLSEITDKDSKPFSEAEEE